MLFHKAAIKADIIKQKPVKRQNADKWFDHERKTIRKDLRKVANKNISNRTTKPYILVTIPNSDRLSRQQTPVHYE